MSDPYAMLLASTNNHRMTVLRDEGLYRHIRFKEPGTSIWWFDLVTWPGHLVITGDLQDYHFARLPDMFEFFRKPPGYINASYWSEKLCGHHQQYMLYTPENFKRRVFEYFREWCEWHDGPHLPLWQAIREDVLAEAEFFDEGFAHKTLADFKFYPDEPWGIAPAPERDFVPAQREADFVPQFIPKVPNRRRRLEGRRGGRECFEFTDSWEWELKDYDYHFLLSLHAIVWGINQYDQAATRVQHRGAPAPTLLGLRSIRQAGSGSP